QFNETEVENVTERTAKNTSNFNARQVDRQFISVLGVAPMRSEPYLVPQIESFVQRNVSLIKSIPSDYFQDLEILVRTRIEEGVSTTALKKEIFEKFGKITTRSALIARDQINKFQGSLSRLRQMESGVTHYIWVTAADERVRPNHRAADGKKVSWKSKGLPVGNKGEFHHPGFDYQCRCFSQPILDDFVKQPSRASGIMAGSVL
ncbi:minor capsid protein, partial [Candidatus Pacearchaeota archaeon]|nr:minor capsid protein [Candidatus Pacearchaeota archaeon]